MAQSPILTFHWGNTSLRGWAITPDGEILESFDAPEGLTEAKKQGYAPLFEKISTPFLGKYPGAPVLIVGMAGARGAWKEAPYAPCPLTNSALVKQAVRFDFLGHPAMILPGATFKDSLGNSDVMRGEEVQLLGALQLLGINDATVSIPGKHCKLAVLKDGTFQQFRSFITGELFELLSTQSLVGALAEDGSFDEATFRQGVQHGATAPLATAVFASRANTLQGDLEPHKVTSFLSGVLIGHEAAQVRKAAHGPVILMASGLLADRYAVAFDTLGVSFQQIDAKDCMKEGLRNIATEFEGAVA